MSTYEPLWVISLEDGSELCRITSIGIQLRENDELSYEGESYKVESVFLELAKRVLGDGEVTFWNTPKMKVVVSVMP